MAGTAGHTPVTDAGGQRASSHVSGFRQRAREWGLKRAVYWQVMHMLAKWLGFRIHRVYVGADRHDLRHVHPPAVPPGYEIRWGRKEDFVPFVGKIPGLDQAFVESAFARGDECSVAFYGDELVNFCFNTRSRARVTDQLDVLVPKGFRYVYKSWTHPDHRRRNLSAMGAFVRNTTREAPFHERSISYVETHNYPSLLRSYRHPSERAIKFGLVGWVTLFGRQIPFNSRKARRIGLEFVRNSDTGRRQYAL